ncbi:histone-like nucleoid-structuring protein Lsr2 [Rhodococcus qingshengii]|uniref:histone-like nucleoid-structuring protein Lsr2 n=1 Tax=Rhodococcus qingshengii TaxID=334542 RepID=UPI0010A63CB8|nr:Lsr2 family protein [Rhodococcus qingshengii]THJ65559.1 Lsr2 family protein [Rhodococcus qingshengii]
MSEKIIRQLIDDLDGKPIDDGYAERIHFSYQGADYRIDLRPTNAEKLEAALHPYLEAAEQISSATRGRIIDGPHTNRSKEQFQQIRNWANIHGYRVAPRGRIRSEILRAFDAAH